MAVAGGSRVARPHRPRARRRPLRPRPARRRPRAGSRSARPIRLAADVRRPPRRAQLRALELERGVRRSPPSRPRRRGRSAARSPPPPSHSQRTSVALELWREAEPIGRQLSAVHIRGRGVDRPIPISDALRHHRAVPACVYAAKGPSRPALLAAVTSADGEFCAVEVTYLAPGGGRALGVRTSRKVIGVLPAGCAVRLDAVCEELVVGEGVFSTLSAAGRFSQPGWALLSAHNLRAWIPPVGVRRVLIAGDRGVEGERSARFLRRRLRSPELSASIAWPPVGAGDWNEA